jgi:hypothetical protein
MQDVAAGSGDQVSIRDPASFAFFMKLVEGSDNA